MFRPGVTEFCGNRTLKHTLSATLMVSGVIYSFHLIYSL